MEELTWTEEELKEFDRVTAMQDSYDQVTRINGRFETQRLIEKHGKAKCDAMFAELTKT